MQVMQPLQGALAASAAHMSACTGFVRRTLEFSFLDLHCSCKRLMRSVWVPRR